MLSFLIHNHILKPACELIIITYMLKWKFELNARKLLRRAFWDFPGGPAVRTPSFCCRGRGFNPWSGCSDSACCGMAKNKTNKQQQQNRTNEDVYVWASLVAGRPGFDP